MLISNLRPETELAMSAARVLQSRAAKAWNSARAMYCLDLQIPYRAGGSKRCACDRCAGGGECREVRLRRLHRARNTRWASKKEKARIAALAY